MGLKQDGSSVRWNGVDLYEVECSKYQVDMVVDGTKWREVS